MYFTNNSMMAFELMMQGVPGFDRYDDHAENTCHECRTCRFHRPHWKYAERDRRVLQMINADPDLRVYVEKKIGCAAETIFNVAAAKEGGTNGKTANASEDQHPEDVPVTPA